MKVIYSFCFVLILILIPYGGVKWGHLEGFFGIVLPYFALAAFLVGFVYRVVQWAKSPVPFSIPTTCGQQKSLPWIQQDKLDNPSNRVEVLARMALEVLFFRSLFRNTRINWDKGEKLGLSSSKWLWLGGLAFHWSLLIIITRHLRFAIEPVPGFLEGLIRMDTFLQIGVPMLYLTDVVIVAALTYLFLRRLVTPQLKIISLVADFFPVLLIFSIAGSGILMRYFFKVDVIRVKELFLGLVQFSPSLSEPIGTLFYVHLFLVCTLLMYLPLSKLMHMGGIFLSPTRNLPNTSRMVRHINPWNYPVKVHSYAEYEEEFRKKMKKAGIPVEME
jgi:nitrate reductase gamma subunit